MPDENSSKPFVFLLDVDNTLINNDRLKEAIKNALVTILGEEETEHFWQHHDNFRQKEKLVDFPTIIKQYCAEEHSDTCDLTLQRIFENLSFDSCLFDQTQEMLQFLKQRGKVLIFTEGDMVYQKMKVEKSGLAAQVDEVLLYEHKLEHFAEVVNRFADAQLVVVDDKAELLAKIKLLTPETTTVHVCQGHHATVCDHAQADLTVDTIAQLMSEGAWSKI